MGRLHLLLVAILLALCICIVCSQHISCDGLFCTLKSDKSYFEVDIYGARLYLLDSEGNPRKEFSSLGLGFSHIIEREKNITDPGRNESVCLTAAQQDPTLNYDLEDDITFGAIRQIFTLSEMVTFVTELPNYPAEDIHTVKFTSYNGPDPILSVIYSLSLIDLNVTLSDDTTYTYGQVAQARYKANALKLTLDFPNFPWVSSSTGQNWTESFVALYSNVTYKFTDGDIFLIDETDGPYVQITNENYEYAMAYRLDPFYLIDQVPYSANANSNKTETIPGILIPPQIFSNLELCKNTFGHWNNLVYDPSIGVLFSNFPAPDQPESDAAAKGRKGSLLAVYIIVPLVIVGLAAAILVILFVPSVYNVVLKSDPFKRNGIKSAVAAQDGAVTSSSSQTSKPTHIPTRTAATPAAAHSAPTASQTSHASPTTPPSTSWTSIQKPPRS